MSPTSSRTVPASQNGLLLKRKRLSKACASWSKPRMSAPWRRCAGHNSSPAGTLASRENPVTSNNILSLRVFSSAAQRGTKVHAPLEQRGVTRPTSEAHQPHISQALKRLFRKRVTADSMDKNNGSPPKAALTQRASTGARGLDEILSGGLTRGRIYLLEGDPGTGKTTLALQFLLEGIRQGEPGLYVTLSETGEELR